MFDQARNKISSLPIKWQAMLEYSLYLHESAIHPPHAPLPYAWHEGVCQNGLYFGCFEAVMAALDCAYFDPKFAIEQVFNILSLQKSDGFIPATLSFSKELKTRPCSLVATTLWPMVIELLRKKNLIEISLDTLFIFYQALVKQGSYFEKNRACEKGGFFYLDIYDGYCESGYGLELRFLPKSEETLGEKVACVDATSQMFYLYKTLANWAKKLELPFIEHFEKMNQTHLFIEEQLYCEKTHFFYDQWHLDQGSEKLQEQCLASCLGLWPVYTGAASSDVALSILREYLLSPEHFYFPHPLATLSAKSPHFSPLAWLGPSCNSQLLWLSMGLESYGLSQTSAHLIERALDKTAHHFLRTQTLWEFYPSDGNHPGQLIKLVGEELHTPLTNHLPSNPILSLSQIYKELRP